MSEPLLAVSNLAISFVTDHGISPVLLDVSFHINSKEIVCLVGESGCGKTTLAFAIMRLLDNHSTTSKGIILFQGVDLTALSEKEMQSIRGNKIGIVFQEPMTSLNPLMNIGDQISEGLMLHHHLNRYDARNEAFKLLRLVRFPSPEHAFRSYPHQLSGGMRQRVMMAMAIACRPLLLIADEPTTALDMTIQADILDLLCLLRNEIGISILLITHSFGITAEIADRILVMHEGRIVEDASALNLFSNPTHPYTIALMNSIPKPVKPAG